MYQAWRDQIDNREDDHPNNLIKVRDEIDAHLADESDDGIAWTMLSEACYWLGEYDTDDSKKEAAHQQGVRAGERAAIYSEDDVAAHLWYAANMGSHGLIKGIMSSLFYIKPIEKHALIAVDLDEAFFFAAPLRLLGRFYQQCPGWPVGSGDKNKAIDLLKSAVELSPEFLLNRYFLATVYAEKRKRGQAKELLTEIASVTDLEPYPMYQEMVQGWAKNLLFDLG